MEIRDDVRTFRLGYDDFDGPNPLCVALVETDDATVLFGSGHETTATEILAIAREHDVDVVVPEHGDADHYGGIPTLREELDRSIAVGVPSGDEGWIVEAGVEPDRLLADGETYWGVEAIEVPGHTPGNMAFLYGDVLLAGDTLVGADFSPIAVDDWSGAFGIVPPSRNTGGDEAAIESVRRLLDFEFETALVAHGANVLEGGRAEVRALVDDLDGGIERTDF